MNTNHFRTEEERQTKLSPKEQEQILQANPSFISILSAVYFDNFDLPCPVKVGVQNKNNDVIFVVLRKSRHGVVQMEAQVYKALKEYGLPVPEVLSEPFESEDGSYAAVYSLLPGENLQKLSMRSEDDLQIAKELLVQAVIELMDATDFIKKQKVSKIIPSITLIDELEALNIDENLWLEEGVYKDAFRKLQSVIRDVNTPLVLSNGDYQPGNFLAQDRIITGFLDFESSSFQDPIMGFVKYPIYDLFPLSRTTVVELFLDKKGFSEKEYNYRLVLGCLKILKKEIPISGGNTEVQDYRTRVLALLKKAMEVCNLL